MKYNKENFILLLKEKYEEPFEIIEYNGVSKEGIYRCGYCNQDYKIAKMEKLLAVERKHLCSHCFRSKYAEKVLEVFEWKKELIFKSFGYKKNLQKPTVIFECVNCGLETEKPYVEFLKYPTCIHCGNNAKRRIKDTIPIPEDFEILEDYEDQYTKKTFSS